MKSKWIAGGLYHPMATLGRIAIEKLEGHEEARELFLNSMDYAIKTGQHFKYEWPVMFNVKTLKVDRGERKPHEPGQSDVGGLYAFVMLQAYELTGKVRFLNEAQKAIDAVIRAGYGFNLMYQANITAWGALGCLQLSKITGEARYLEQSNMFLASFFHNTLMWKSKLGMAVHYPTFMGVTCLNDAPYMAAYEEFEAFVAFQEYLMKGQDMVPESGERCCCQNTANMRSTRAWYYYPQELPTQSGSGHPDPQWSY